MLRPPSLSRPNPSATQVVQPLSWPQPGGNPRRRRLLAAASGVLLAVLGLGLYLVYSARASAPAPQTKLQPAAPSKPPIGALTGAAPYVPPR